MTRLISVLLTAAGIVALSAGPANAARTARSAADTEKPQSAALIDVDRQIIVRFRSGADAGERAAARRNADVSFKRGMRTGSQVVFARRAAAVDAAVAALNRNPHVLYAERNARVQALATPNDTYFTELYGLHNTGQELLPGGTQAGLADADIDAVEAWDRQTGSADVLVAVVDEGVAYRHPDLDGNLWTNSAEAGGTAGADDDGNGVVDDIKGIDVIDFDTDPHDFGGHGTHVAGTIAAEGNNASGIAGVVWDARIMPVRVLGGGGGSNESVAAGFDYAGDMGADIVNASLGGSSFSQEIANAVSSHPDTLYVVAAGNGGDDGVGDNNEITPQYPCNLTMANLICVAATGTSDTLTSFSNFGATSVDLAAPGEWILSALAERSGQLRVDLFDASLAGWTTTDWIWHTDGGNGAATDSSGANNYLNNASDIMSMSTSLNLSGRTGCTMDMELWTNIEPLFQGEIVDALWVDRSTDGGASWAPIAAFYGDIQGPGNTYEFIEQIDLKADGAANTRIRFRFESDSSVVGDGAWINALQVTCEGAYDGDSYHYLDGTSMATPHVAGAAALLLSERPNLTVPQLRAALLSTGDVLAGLSGKVVTQRRLNVEKALDVVEAYPEVSTEAATGVTETAATLNGTVNPVGTATSYEFEYGVTPSYGLKTPLGSAGSASVTGPVSAAVSGLVAGTTYHYRLVAIRGAERFPGPDRTFQTLTASGGTTTGGTTTGGTTTGGTTTGGTTTGGTTTGGTLTPAEAVAAMKRTAKISCKRKGSKRTCKVTAQGATKVRVSIKKGKRTAKGSGKPGKTIRLKGRLPRGRYTVKVVIIDAAGNRATITRKFRL